MHARRSFGERTRAAIGDWMPMDGSKFALVFIVALTGALLVMFAH
jgi:hypothetical protein